MAGWVGVDLEVVGLVVIRRALEQTGSKRHDFVVCCVDVLDGQATNQVSRPRPICIQAERDRRWLLGLSPRTTLAS